MVQYLPHRTAIIYSPRLFSIYSVHRREPEGSKEGQSEVPAWQLLVKPWIDDCCHNHGDDWENHSHESDSIWRQGVWQTAIRYKVPVWLIEGCLNNCKSTCLVSKFLDSFDVILFEVY